ncbi:MAG TPA: hypothetical protein VFE60_23460 [Roseiarcus sp.]|nr:hypothetical protein [Roseiarcus sp.]
MIRIAITQAAFEAIARTLPLGSVSFENKIDENGDRLIWLELNGVDRLRAMRGRGESWSHVILRLARRAERGAEAGAELRSKAVGEPCAQRPVRQTSPDANGQSRIVPADKGTSPESFSRLTGSFLFGFSFQS